MSTPHILFQEDDTRPEDMTTLADWWKQTFPDRDYREDLKNSEEIDLGDTFIYFVKVGDRTLIVTHAPEGGMVEKGTDDYIQKIRGHKVQHDFHETIHRVKKHLGYKTKIVDDEGYHILIPGDEVKPCYAFKMVQGKYEVVFADTINAFGDQQVTAVASTFQEAWEQATKQPWPVQE